VSCSDYPYTTCGEYDRRSLSYKINCLLFHSIIKLLLIVYCFTGSGRVTFGNQKSFMKAVQAGFIEIKTSKFTKKVRALQLICTRTKKLLHSFVFRFKLTLTWRTRCAVFVTELWGHISAGIYTVSSTIVAPVGNGSMLWMPLPTIGHSLALQSQAVPSK